MKASPEDTDTDTHMSEAGDENSFARANQGDSPDWTLRPLPIIQAALHPEDPATHEISNDNAEEGPSDFPTYPPPGGAVSSPMSMFPATTAGGAVFYMQDTSQAANRSPGGAVPTRSDVSMVTASHDNASTGAADLSSKDGNNGSRSIGAYSEEHGTGGADAGASTARSRAETHPEASDSGQCERADSHHLPESLGQDVGDDDAVLDAASNASDGGRSELGEFQDLSDDDLPKKDFDADISLGYEEA